MPSPVDPIAKQQVCKVLRAELHDGLKDFLHPDPDEITKRFQEFLISALRMKVKLSESILTAAAQEVFPKQAGEASSWAKMMTLALSHCKKKAHSLTSGLKLAEGTR